MPQVADNSYVKLDIIPDAKAKEMAEQAGQAGQKAQEGVSGVGYVNILFALQSSSLLTNLCLFNLQ